MLGGGGVGYISEFGGGRVGGCSSEVWYAEV
jgi:hypothetical protein